jgi:hypothetical protein
MTLHTFGKWSVVTLVILAVVGAAVRWVWPQPREAFYSLYRDRGRSRTIAGLMDYQVKSGKYTDVYYTDADADVVDWIVETADKVYGPVTQAVGFRPGGRVPIIVYPSRDELRHAFGWGNGESAMGVYWSGTVRLLSPNVWIHEQNDKDKRQVFQRLNPLAHELTHYVLDYMTNGNYPRWFTEGLAQRVEYKVTGYLWIEPESTLRQDLYTLQDLKDHYDQLQNQPLAYRESFLLVDYVARHYGEETLTDLIQLLGKGVGFDQAVRTATGESPDTLFGHWQDWVKTNLDVLEPAS